MNKVTLLDGTIIERAAGALFPPLQEVIQIERACTVCPVQRICRNVNDGDCQTLAMFDGFVIDLQHAIELAPFVHDRLPLFVIRHESRYLVDLQNGQPFMIDDPQGASRYTLAEVEAQNQLLHELDIHPEVILVSLVNIG